MAYGASALLAARPYSAIREECSSTSPAVGRWEQLVQSLHLARRQVPCEYVVVCSLGHDETVATDGTMPIICMRRTSPRLEVGMCATD